MPFRGQSPWLEEAIRSIQEQTFTAWELLLIDNGANNAARSISNSVATNDSRIRIIDENIPGISHALNSGLKQARSEIIARMDADDISHPERLQHQWYKLHGEKGDVVVGSRVDAVPGFNPAPGMQEYMDWHNSLVSAEDHYLNRFIDAPVVHPTVFCRKELFDRHGYYSLSAVPEDYELWLRWMGSGVRFIKNEEALLSWRDHEGRLTRTHPHYDASKFAEVRINYLTRWLKENIGTRRLVFCGTSGKSRKRAQQLISAGITIAAFTDVKRQYRNVPYLPIEDIGKDKDYFYLSLLPRRASNSLRDFLYKRGLTEGRDFLLAG